MAQFINLINTGGGGGGGLISSIQGNGTTLPPESILNFVGPNFTFTDDPGNTRTNVILPALLPLAGGTMTGPLILSADPTNPLGAATKEYVDSVGSGLTAHTNCVNKTTGANLNAVYNNGAAGVGATLTNAGAQAAFSLDGHANSVNDRVLITDQTSAFQNGIYTVTTVGTGATNWVLTRATDFNTAAAGNVAVGAYVVISQGTTYAGSLWVETGPGPFTIGTTPIVFSLWSNLSNLSATAPLVLTGNVLSLTSPLPATNGGTGVSNSNTITLGGNIVTAGPFITAGNNSLTLTTTGPTNVTLPTSGTLITSGVTALPSLVTVGTIGTGVWNGTIISPVFGGTGVNNGSNTITLGGTLTTAGAFNSTFTMTGTTNVTFPTSGTLATTAQIPALPVTLANGGTSASLVASNGGIFYSTASTGAILAGTATANQVLLSGTSAAPAWSTATYPATTTINQILYSSAANTIAGLATGNNGVLITSAGGVPSISSTIPAATQLNITQLGTITTGVWNGTAVGVTHGGTGLTACNQGDLFYGSAANTISTLAKNTTATRYLANTGATNNPNWDQVNLTNGVTGILPVANGGTGVAGLNAVIQRVSTITGAVATGTTSVSDTDAIPTNTSGDEYMTLAITPKNAANVLVIEVVWNGSSNVPGGYDMIVSLFQDATVNALASAINTGFTASYFTPVVFRYVMTAGTTSSTTFKVRAGVGTAGTNTFNGAAGARRMGGVFASSIMITEYSS